MAALHKPVGVHAFATAAGSNFRLPQPLNGRVLRVWRDSNSKKGYLPNDAASAASAGGLRTQGLSAADVLIMRGWLGL